MTKNKKMVFTLKSGKSIVQTISEQDSINLIEKYLSSLDNESLNRLYELILRYKKEMLEYLS